MKINDLVKELKIIKPYHEYKYSIDSRDEHLYNNWGQIKEDIRLLINKRGEQVKDRYDLAQKLNKLLPIINIAMETGEISIADLDDYNDVIGVTNMFIHRFNLKQPPLRPKNEYSFMEVIEKSQRLRDEESKNLIANYEKLVINYIKINRGTSIKINDLVKDLRIDKLPKSHSFMGDKNDTYVYESWGQIREDVQCMLSKKNLEVKVKRKTSEMFDTLLSGISAKIDTQEISKADLVDYREIVSLAFIYIKKYNIGYGDPNSYSFFSQQYNVMTNNGMLKAYAKVREKF